ncbi:Receptor-type tyrosine-protein phosphatase beta [Chionoecetes opilio]|uniref:Receptor-type tyrosine-protein phosphatase beta n=1 Tax=Chionoecetes opilio TaxID=41210 RepID=A0A8J4XLQ8_CHIOP|nr:Receptor-type tyrosine-protein phosphatase beta [Chionoecetes opilio]
MDDEAIYEYLKPEESSATIASRIPWSEVEAYLNKVIGSKKAGDNFQTVPSTIPKSMKVAQHPENKSKNQLEKNHPYDDTRVVLSCLHDDPNSDYINANHVQVSSNSFHKRTSPSSEYWFIWTSTLIPIKHLHYH